MLNHNCQERALWESAVVVGWVSRMYAPLDQTWNPSVCFPQLANIYSDGNGRQHCSVITALRVCLYCHLCHCFFKTVKLYSFSLSVFSAVQEIIWMRILKGTMWMNDVIQRYAINITKSQLCKSKTTFFLDQFPQIPRHSSSENQRICFVNLHVIREVNAQ